MATTFPLGPVLQRPGIGADFSAAYRNVCRNGRPVYYPGGGVIDGTKSRDTCLASTWAYLLRPGLLMGKVTSGGHYANSCLGLTNGAIASTDTSVTLPTLVAAEINRRIGATGTFKITGPPTASGVVRTLTATYSAVGSTTATITALGVNDVQTLNFANSPAGSFALRITDLNGLRTTTGAITYSGTAATLVSNINTALNTAFGSSLIVASGSVVTAIAITFSGTGYAGLPQPEVIVDDDGLTAGTVAVTHTTLGVDGRFVTASLVQPTDGSETILSFIPDDIGILLDDTAPVDVNFPEIPIGLQPGGVVTQSQLLPWPADASTQAYIMAQLNVYGRYTFENF